MDYLARQVDLELRAEPCEQVEKRLRDPVLE